MARTQTQEIELPWKKTPKGAVAELGAVFRVELIGGDWQCSVKSGRCREVIARGLKGQAEGKRRAQAHAATMPEVIEAAGLDEPASKPPRAKKAATKRAAKKATAAKRAPRDDTETAAEHPPATQPPPTTPPPPAAPPSAITFKQTEDGCLCGKTEGVCWVANAKEVALARPLPDDVIAKIRDAVAQHYAAQEAASEPTAPRAQRGPRAPRTQRAPRATSKPREKAAKREPKPAKKENAAKPAKEPRGRKAGRGRASKPKAAKTKQNETKEEVPVKEKKQATPAAKPAAKPTTNSAAPVAAAPSGPLTWIEIEGKPRGTAAHGTFLIEPEGQGFGLYFADSSGQARHLRSGTVAELRRAAEEFAARGEPSTREAPSREQDEALMRIFASGAVEGA